MKKKAYVYFDVSEEVVKDRVFATPMIFSTIIIIPKRTLIYIFYLIILICGQLSELQPEFKDMLPLGLKEFVQINQYAIVLLIAIDRIITNYKREKEFNPIVIPLSKFIKKIARKLTNEFRKIFSNKNKS